ncbi:MAG: trypsin-like peptidase domain-containing protein [Oscillospiraceae bacterium]|nr:trypsin-like peptidase domain-containing protein [Oscillospiraceae bacterium]
MLDNFNNDIYNSNNENKVNENYSSGNWNYSYAAESQDGNTEISNVSNNQIIEPARKIRNKNKKHLYFSQLVSTLVACVICSGLVGGVLTYSFSNKIDAQNAIISQLQNSSSVSNNFIGAAYTKTNDISSVVAEVSPSVVGIKLDVSQSYSGFSSRFMNLQPQQATLEGSGIILTKDGYIATNYHVVSYADPNNNSGVTLDNMEVHFSDGTIAKATFVGGDEANDLAVIKVDLNNLKPASFGDSSSLKVGDTALAIGNPLGLEFAGTVTQGIISAVDRAVDVGDGTTKNLIQTDAAINEGNSGGALVNSSGEVIGINCAKIEASGVEGIGFAIPINVAKPILNSFMK